VELDKFYSVQVTLSKPLLEAIDKIREDWGIKSRGDVIERLLNELLAPDAT
jgi:metal-responsive CopG/Arc/MetJ family transcriptional regulator